MELKNAEFKNYYIAIFSVNYLFQGIDQSLFAIIIPIYLISIIGVLDASAIAFLGSIIGLPWILKILYGMIGDKFGSKRFGRRRPWIIGMVSFAGIVWIIMGIPNFYTPSNAITAFTIMGFLIFLGMAFGDTIVDGLVLDITPKEKLGRTAGYTWGLRSVGAIAGGPAFAILLVSGLLNVSMLFIIVGILTILSSLLIIFIKEPKEYPEAKLGLHLKNMFNNSRDWKAYAFSLFAAMVENVGILIISIFILVKMGVLTSVGTELSLPSGEVDVYLYNAFITMIVSLGVVTGAIIAGQIADKKTRRLSVLSAFIITTITLFLMIIPLAWPILLIFSSFVGIAIGWRHSSYAAVVTEISKLHPEMDSTYYSLCNAFANLGGILGLSLSGIVLELTASYIYVFIFVAVISNLGLIGFLLLNPKDYEHTL
jgi:MFS family permease